MSNRLRKKAGSFAPGFEDCILAGNYVPVPLWMRLRILFTGGFTYNVKIPTQRRVGKTGPVDLVVKPGRHT